MSKNKITRLLNNILWNIKQIKNIPYSIYLCVRFPFLYPRNRFNGLHYTNWKLHSFVIDSNHKAYSYGGKEENFKQTIKSKKWVIIYKIAEWIENYPLQVLHCIPTYTELSAMPNGWRKCFGIQMCKEIKQSLKRNNFLYKYRVCDIKEKWSELRWYDNSAPDEVHRIIEKYEYISQRTCIHCGMPATKQTEGYILPYCDDCFPKDKYSFTAYDDWYGYKTYINGKKQ